MTQGVCFQFVRMGRVVLVGVVLHVCMLSPFALVGLYTFASSDTSVLAIELVGLKFFFSCPGNRDHVVVPEVPDCDAAVLAMFLEPG